MNKSIKTFLASVILTPGVFAASAGDNIILNLAENAPNNGTINVYAGMTIRIAEGKWIANKGKIILKDDVDSGKDPVFIQGTSDGQDGETTEITSGIKNYGHSFEKIVTDDKSDVQPNVQDITVAPNEGFCWSPLEAISGVILKSDGVTPAVKGVNYKEFNGSGVVEIAEGSIYT